MKTQWRAVPREELECSGQRIIEDEKGDEVAYVGFDEDAEFIALACNAHDGLVEQVKAAKQAGMAMLKQEMERTQMVMDLREQNAGLVEALKGMVEAWNMVCDTQGWERDHIQAQVNAVAALASVGAT